MKSSTLVLVRFAVAKLTVGAREQCFVLVCSSYNVTNIEMINVTTLLVARIQIHTHAQFAKSRNCFGLVGFKVISPLQEWI